MKINETYSGQLKKKIKDIGYGSPFEINGIYYIRVNISHHSTKNSVHEYAYAARLSNGVIDEYLRDTLVNIIKMEANVLRRSFN